MVSVYVVCVMLMVCTVEYREMCYGTSICNVCNGDGVYNSIEKNVLSSEHKLPYSCLCSIHQTEVAIKLSVMYRAKEFAIELSVLYR